MKNKNWLDYGEWLSGFFTFWPIVFAANAILSTLTKEYFTVFLCTWMTIFTTYKSIYDKKYRKIYFIYDEKNKNVLKWYVSEKEAKMDCPKQCTVYYMRLNDK